MNTYAQSHVGHWIEAAAVWALLLIAVFGLLALAAQDPLAPPAPTSFRYTHCDWIHTQLDQGTTVLIEGRGCR